MYLLAVTVTIISWRTTLLSAFVQQINPPLLENLSNLPLLYRLPSEVDLVEDGGWVLSYATIFPFRTRIYMLEAAAGSGRQSCCTACDSPRRGHRNSSRYRHPTFSAKILARLAFVVTTAFPRKTCGLAIRVAHSGYLSTQA